MASSMRVGNDGKLGPIQDSRHNVDAVDNLATGDHRLRMKASLPDI
jgi:hypothetical protein